MHAEHNTRGRITGILIFLSLILLTSVTESQAQRRYRLWHGFRQTYPGAIAIGFQAGGSGSYAFNGPRAACNCEFDNGSGLGYHAGMHLEIFVNRYFGLRFQGNYEALSTTYTKDVPGTVYLSDGSFAEIVAERRIEADMKYAIVYFDAVWFTGAGGLYFLTGAGAGFYLDGSILEEEYLREPSDLLYPQTGSSRIVYRDEALDASSETEIRALLSAGIGYDLPLGRGAVLAPEFQFDFPLTSVVSGNADWRVATLRASMVLRFGL